MDTVTSRRRLLLITTAAAGVAAGILLLFAPQPAIAQESQPPGDAADELLFYRDDGLHAFYDVRPTGSLGTKLRSGPGYTTDWSQITALDLEGDGRDELFFYRDDGLHAFYDVRSTGSLATKLRSGFGYTTDWSQITALDLEGDGRDELFFYRDDGLHAFYKVGTDGSLGTKLRSGYGYTTDWSQITALDLEGDGRDELLFYRDDGLYAVYAVGANGALGTKLQSGTGLTSGWSQITALDLDADGGDELLFYRADGLYAFYDVRPDGALGTKLRSGTGYTKGWSQITALDLDRPPPGRVSRFTTYFDCCQNRVVNIRTIAAAIDGTVVRPGETFSIDRTVGPRTAAKGYLPAPYLVNGESACCAEGGGVSQFGTTIHNAVFWGGYEVIAHRPHTGWISRYPLGIEATLVYGSIDYRFRNDTSTPVTIRTSSTPTSVTVELWGYQGGWQVSGYHPRGARSSVLTVLSQGGPTAKRVAGVVYGSAPGPVRIVRTLTKNGVSTTQTWGWFYVT